LHQRVRDHWIAIFGAETVEKTLCEDVIDVKQSVRGMFLASG
jgi:hypothetical protein